MRAKRGLGQNFLVGSHYRQRIISSVNPRPNETIVEIGPGHGALTASLIESGARVIAIELDSDLVAQLNSRFGSQANFSLIEADALSINFRVLIAPSATARVVANLPYNISTPILRRLIEERDSIIEMTLMLQREVVERIAAEPGGKEYGYLSVLAQYYCEAERLFDVPPGAFRPAPKVWSSVVRLSVREHPVDPVRDESLLAELVSVLFAQRRKTVLNNLRAGAQRLKLTETTQIADLLASVGIDPRRRAETLSIGEIARLANGVGNLT